MSNETEQLHKDLREQTKSIKALTSEVSDLNKILIEIVSDNKHRDAKIESCEAKVSKVESDVAALHTMRVQDREEYKPVWDRAKKDQQKSDGWVSNLTWFGIVALMLIISNSISSGAIKPWFAGSQKDAQHEKKN